MDKEPGQGICRRTLAYGKVQPDFAAEVARIRRAYAATLRAGRMPVPLRG